MSVLSEPDRAEQLCRVSADPMFTVSYHLPSVQSPRVVGARPRLTSRVVYNTGKMGLVSCCGAMCLGHESSGLIVRLGANVAAKAVAADKASDALANRKADKATAQSVVGKRIGDKVTLEPGVTCRMCHDCRGGQYQVGRSRAMAMAMACLRV
jgi:hypothetical protein